MTKDFISFVTKNGKRYYEIPINPLDAKVRDLHDIMYILKAQYRGPTKYKFMNNNYIYPLWHINSPARIFFEYVRAIMRMLGLAEQYETFIKINEDRIFQSKRQYGHLKLSNEHNGDTRLEPLVMDSYNFFECIFVQFYNFLIVEPDFIRSGRWSCRGLNEIICVREPLLYKYHIHGTIRQNIDKPNFEQLFSESDCTFRTKYNM